MAMFIQTINGYLWGFPMIAFLFCTHIFLSVRTGFVQRRVLRGIRFSVSSGDKGKGELSPFACLATTLASTLGTGNIIGVGSAVAFGGAGAVFWCWITGILGMATQYCECMLSVKFRRRTPQGEYCGGPMYVLRYGAGSKVSGIFYAFMAAVCGLVTGAAIQSNSIAEILLADTERTSDVKVRFLVGFVTASMAALVIFGGVKSIGRVCSFLVPFMAGAFILGCFVVLFINRAVILTALKLIVCEAFSLRGVSGGVQGSVIMLACRYGMARGLFSNEAGLGTSSVVCACADTSHHVRQGIVSMTATFWDTVVMCLVTGVVIVSSQLSKFGKVEIGTMQGGSLCLQAFSSIPYIGEGVLVFSLVTFAFSTVLGWSVIGEKCITFIFGEKSRGVYRLLWIIAVLLAPVCALEGVWALGDFVNGLLVIPNVTGLLLLAGTVGKDTKEYFAK